MTMGENIKRLRKEAGLTQKELGERLGGISQQQIGQWETGKANPKIDTIKKIAAGLGVPWETLVTDATPQEVGSIIKSGMQDMIESLNLDVDLSNGNVWDTTMKLLEKRAKYIKLYDSLNFEGQDKAIEHVEMIAKIPAYQRNAPKNTNT